MAFSGAGTKAGTLVWRIENRECVLVDPKFHGSFYTGDSYIILHSVPKKGSTGFTHTVYNWVGNESSADEKGISAYKMVELDDLLGGDPVQRNLQQGNETPEFIALWKGGLHYLDGGVASGFTHVERDSYEPRLLHLKGKRYVKSRQVPLDASSLNDGDVFILDLGLSIYVFNGAHANKWEKAKGLDVARNIRDVERGGKPVIHPVIEQNSSDDAEEFWAALGGKKPIAKADEDVDEPKAPVRLFHLSDASGTMTFSEVTERPLVQSMLLNNDVYILDVGTEIYIWVGKGSNVNEKKEATKNANDYVAQNCANKKTPIVRVAEGNEPVTFTSNFAKWIVPSSFLPGYNPGKGVAKVEAKDIDFKALQAAKEAKKEGPLPDPAGKTTVWRIENFAKVPVPEDRKGHFAAGDSFIVLYEWPASSNNKPFIFFWQGLTSSTDEKGASALLADQLDKEMGGLPIQVRVVQGKEPAEFLALFQGKFIVHAGGVASGFSNRADKDSFDLDGTALFQVKGTSKLTTRATQVEEVAGSLNSGDCFVLVTPGDTYVWNGQGATEQEKANAHVYAKELSPSKDAVTVEEGSEPDAFWSALGGKADYAVFDAEDEIDNPRLFELSDASGRLDMEEVYDFGQDDLRTENVYILDTKKVVYVWVGAATTEQEKKNAVPIAAQFVEAATDGRGSSTIIRMDEGGESHSFTSLFNGWVKRAGAPAAAAPASTGSAPAASPAKPSAPVTVAVKASPAAGSAAPAAASSSSAAPTTTAAALRPAAGYADPTSKKYTYQELLARPEDVDPAMRQEYLSDAEFQTVMGTTRADFNSWKKWKQDDKKKATKLF